MVIWDGVFPVEGPTYSETAARTSFSFDSIQGPPAPPLEFPAPSVHRGARCNTVALDHRKGRIYAIKNVLMRVSGTPQQAFLIKKTISKSVYGVIRLCVVLKRRSPTNFSKDDSSGRRRHSYGSIRDEDAVWESTEELAVVKVCISIVDPFPFWSCDHIAISWDSKSLKTSSFHLFVLLLSFTSKLTAPSHCIRHPLGRPFAVCVDDTWRIRSKKWRQCSSWETITRM